jgi:DNA-binding transcriptional MerR regulator
MQGEDLMAEMKLKELAEKSGVPARTIRLYIARQLLPPPLRGGRKAAYGDKHLERLSAIRRMQQEGMTLEQIRRELAGPSATPELPEPVTWVNYPVASDVIVQVRADAGGWRQKVILRAIGLFMENLNQSTRETKNHGDVS